MKNYGMVTGARPQEIEITDITVRIATEIREVTRVDSETGEDVQEFEYNLVEYDKDEYIKLLQGQITDTELAIVELYEEVLGNG